MPRLVNLKTGISIELENTPFASGGEGDLFKIISPSNFHNQVVKIYKPEKRTKERENKIEFLIANPPDFQVQDGHHTIIWMNHVVYENGKFIGFVMPIGKGKELEFLCHEKKPKHLTSEWDKFNFINNGALVLRVKLCFNIAVALYHIHKLGLYVLVDLKPQNILVQPNGLISIIDIDSVAVMRDSKVLYAAPVTTPEYTPPEYYRKSSPVSTDYIHETWDRFSLAVIFYRLLCGIHPFVGTCAAPYDKCTGLPEMVENGLFPNGLKKSYFKVIPTPHHNFNKLEKRIQDIFKRCFEKGHIDAKKRPTANEWCQILSNQQLVQINRVLPSSYLNFPSFTHSKSLFYNPSTLVNFTNINFPQNLKLSSLKKVISKIFGKTNKQKIIDAIIEQVALLKLKYEKKEFFEQELRNLHSNFQNEQFSILEKEKQKVEEQKKAFDLQKQKYDTEAKTLFYQEQQEMDEVLKDTNNLISSKEYSIQLYYKNNIQNRFEKNENNKSAIQLRIAALQNQMNLELQKEINHPNKLSNYNIAANAINIFSYYEMANIKDLRTLGFNTAADFIDADSSGLLKHRYKGWIKVPGIAKVRAKQLNDWRKKIEAKEDSNISHKVHSAYQGNFNTLNQSLSKLENDFKKEIYSFQTEYEKQKKDLVLYKLNLKKLLLEKNNFVKNKYDKINQQLTEKCKAQEILVSIDLTKITDSTLKELNKSLQNYIAHHLDKWKEINAYKYEIDIEVKKLAQLQKEYHFYQI